MPAVHRQNTTHSKHTCSFLSLCTQYCKAVLALGLLTIQSSTTCVSQALCVAHTGDSSIICASTRSLFPCIASPCLVWPRQSPVSAGPALSRRVSFPSTQSVISFLQLALNKRVPFQHLPSATRLPCSAVQWETQLPQLASLVLLCAYLM